MNCLYGTSHIINAQCYKLEKTLESSFDSKEIKPVNPKGSQYRRVIGRADAEAEAGILWSLDVEN